MAGATEALYTVKISTETSALDKVTKDVDSLKNATAIPITADTARAAQSIASLKQSAIPITADTARAAQSIEALKQSTKAIAGEAVIRISADSTQATHAIGAAKKEAGALGTSLATPHKVTIHTASAEAGLKKLESDSKSLFDKIKEGGKSMLGGIGGGILAGGAAMALGKSLQAAKEDLKGQEDLKIALRNTGAAGAELDQKFSQSEKQAHALADSYALPVASMRDLETEVANFGGLSGAQATKVTEIGVAFSQFGLSARSLRGVIAGSADPESMQALQTLKTKFAGLGEALAAAKTPAEKMDAVYKRMQPTLEGMKEAANGPIGAMNRMDETGKQLEIGFGSLIFGVLTPFLPIVSGIGSVLNGTVIPALTTMTQAVEANKVPIAIVAGALVTLGVAMKIQEAGGLVASLAKIGAQAAQTSLSILQKFVPALVTKTTVEVAGTATTEASTVATLAFNASLLANPVVWVVAGVVALVVILYELFQHVTVVKTAFDAVWKTLKGVAAFIGAFVSTEVAALSKAFEGVSTVIHGIVTMNFSEVKQGVADVGVAIHTGMTGGAAGVKAFNQSVKDSSPPLDDQKQKSTDAGNAAAQSAAAAAAAENALRDAIKGANTAFTDQGKTVKDQVNSNRVFYERLQGYIRTGYADGVKLSAEKIATLKAESANLLANSKEEQAGLNKIAADGDAFSAAIDNKKKARAHAAKTAAAGGNLLSEAKAAAQEAADELKSTLQLADAQKGIAYSAHDELAVEQKKSEIFNAQAQTLQLMTAEKGKFAAKTSLEQAKSTTQQLTIEAKIKLDDKKLKDDFDKSVVALTKQQIAIGIVPKTEGITLIDSEIDTLQSKLTTLSHTPLLADNPKALAEINATQGNILALYKEQADAKAAIDKQSAANETASMTDAYSRDQIVLASKLKADEELYNTLTAHGIALNAEQSKSKLALEEKYQRDKLALTSKYAILGINVDKHAEGVVAALHTDLFNTTQQQTQLEIDLKRQSFDGDQKNLVKQLQRGEISYQDYNLKLRKIAQDRADYEKKLDGDKFAALTKLGNDFLQQEIKRGEMWLADRLVQIATEGGAFITADESKTLAQTGGAAVRIASSAAEGLASIAVAGANMIAAGASELWEAITSLGPIAGPIVGLAAIGALYAGYRGLKSELGFAAGGMAWVGEKGPEVISPAKEFASYSTSLITNTMKEVRRALEAPNAGASGTIKSRVDVTGRLMTRGRDLNYSLTRNTLAKRSEQMVTN